MRKFTANPGLGPLTSEEVVQVETVPETVWSTLDTVVLPSGRIVKPLKEKN